VSAHAGALEAVDRILNRGGDADDVLRGVVAALHERVFAWVGVAFAEEGRLVIGPEAGERPTEPPLRAPVVWQGTAIGELQAAPREPSDADHALLDRVALLVSPHVLVGWDTGGVPWEDVS
jgi:hypothetical protein